ncbi:subtilisin-like serine protease [Burkholderiales bacterium JOSHI_001]|nr:subtilisin-like serine protease [Burkholderiales bacterium JOSHI_001]
MKIRIVVLALALLVAGAVQAQDRKRIEKAADLPRFSYAVTGSLEALVRDEAAFAGFAAKLRADIETVLAQYDIADRSMQRQLLGVLLQLDVLDRQDSAALARVEAIRALEDKPADKLLAGLQVRAMVGARQALGPDTGDAYRAEVGRRIVAALRAMPYEVISNEIKEAKARAERLGEALILGQVREVLQPVADKTGVLSSDLAPGVVGARYALLNRLPLKQTLVDAFGSYLQAHKVNKPDIWAARRVILEPGHARAPVRVAVWDSGVDSALFKRQLARDAQGRPLLIAFDKYARPSSDELQVLPEAMKSRLPTLLARAKGLADMQSNIDSPQAAEVKAYMSNLKADEFRPAVEELGLTGNYAHGTHVAGIALKDNPYARLLIVRMEFGHTLMPDPCPSPQQAAEDAKAMTAQIEFIKQHQARVVNMSWGGSVKSIEDDLEKCDTAKTPEQRKALARPLFTVMRDALQQGFASAPEILWITAAGNSNQDASFAEDAPADIVLDNLLTVGAVDRAGDEASFTSYGPTVKVHANGYQVESFLPGGSRVAMSGTSMAAPQVANLAAKMLAVNSRLTPRQLIDIIVATADKTADGRRTLVHPAKAVRAAKRKLR